MNEREALDTNEKLTDRVRPTTEPSDTNRHAVRCGVCDGLFYVDDTTYETIGRALAYDPTDNPFTCERCEQEYADEERRA